MGERKESYRKCQSCGYKQTPAEEAEERKCAKSSFKPLAAKCLKCGESTFYLQNIAWV